MAERRGKPRGDDRVVRRPREERRRLDPALEPLAHGETDRLRRPPPRPRLDDPRARFLVPGVANRDAREVHDLRVEALRGAVTALRERPGDGDARAALARALDEARALGLWRGRSVTGFDAFVEQVLGLEPDEARTLLEACPEPLPARLSNEAIAVWMRIEASLSEHEVEGRVRVEVGPDGVERVRFEAESASFPLAVDAMARRLGPLARDVEPSHRRWKDGGRDRDAGEHREHERGWGRDRDRSRDPDRGHDRGQERRWGSDQDRSRDHGPRQDRGWGRGPDDRGRDRGEDRGPPGNRGPGRRGRQG